VPEGGGTPPIYVPSAEDGVFTENKKPRGRGSQMYLMSIRAGGGRHPPNIVPSGHVPSAEDVIKCIVWLIGTYGLNRTIRLEWYFDVYCSA
jgi:hypothetical protein